MPGTRCLAHHSSSAKTRCRSNLRMRDGRCGAPVAEGAPVRAPAVRLDRRAVRRHQAVDVEEAGQVGRRDDVEVGDPVTIGGADHPVAVTHADSGHVVQRRKVEFPGTFGEPSEELGEAHLALAPHGDVDVGVGPEVRLDVVLVLRRVGAAVNRDGGGVAPLQVCRHAQVVGVAPDVVGEEEDRRLVLGDRLDLCLPGDPFVVEVEAFLEATVVDAPRVLDEHPHREWRHVRDEVDRNDAGALRGGPACFLGRRVGRRAVVQRALEPGDPRAGVRRQPGGAARLPSVG